MCLCVIDPSQKKEGSERLSKSREEVRYNCLSLPFKMTMQLSFHVCRFMRNYYYLPFLCSLANHRLVLALFANTKMEQCVVIIISLFSFWKASFPHQHQILLITYQHCVAVYIVWLYMKNSLIRHCSLPLEKYLFNFDYTVNNKIIYGSRFTNVLFII